MSPRPTSIATTTSEDTTMPSEALVSTLKALKLYGMAQAVDELAQQSAPAFSKTESMLNTLIKAEVAEREVRSINYQMKVARFPTYRDLAGFDFNESSVDESLLKSASVRLHWRCS